MNSTELAARIVMTLLVNGQWEVAEALTHGKEMTAEQMEQAVKDYGRTLCLPPADKWETEVCQWGDTGASWNVLVSLWTLEEGLSDLTLDLIVADEPNHLFQVMVRDIHVL